MNVHEGVAAPDDVERCREVGRQDVIQEERHTCRAPKLRARSWASATISGARSIPVTIAPNCFARWNAAPPMPLPTSSTLAPVRNAGPSLARDIPWFPGRRC